MTDDFINAPPCRTMTNRLEDISACVFDAYGTLFDIGCVVRGAPDGSISDLSALSGWLPIHD